MPLTDSFAKLLIRGLLAGLIAGILAGGVAFVLGESHIDAAIAIEESNSAAEAEVHSHDATQAAEPAGHSHDEEEALVSRDGQRFGLFLATSLAGLALGAIFAVVANYARRVTTLSGPLLGLTLATLLVGNRGGAVLQVPRQPTGCRRPRNDHSAHLAVARRSRAGSARGGGLRLRGEGRRSAGIPVAANRGAGSRLPRGGDHRLPRAAHRQ